MVVYLLLSKNTDEELSLREKVDFTACSITQGLKLGIFLNPKIFSASTDFLTYTKKQQQWEPIFLTTENTASLQTHFKGFTSTSMGSKDSFLPHLGHLPSYC
jgi:hypothetical protein